MKFDIVYNEEDIHKQIFSCKIIINNKEEICTRDKGKKLNRDRACRLFLLETI